MKKRTEAILAIMNVLAWIAYIGLMIKAGAYIWNYVTSFFVPESPKNFYNGLNLYDLKQFSYWQFTAVVTFMISITTLQAYTAHLVIKVLSKIKIKNPFTIEVSKLMEKISFFILSIWVVSMIFNVHMSWLSKRVAGNWEQYKVAGDFLFLAGVIFVFAQIFKKGVEIQTENELTV
jgi:hypothetical protein